MEHTQSPFYPDQPLPARLFKGRAELIERMKARHLPKVAAQTSSHVFIQGEYGIGKSSLARFVLGLSDSYELQPIYVNLSGARDVDHAVERFIEECVRSSSSDPTKAEKVKNWLSKYIGEQDILGTFTLRLDELRTDQPQINSPQGLLAFLKNAQTQLDVAGYVVVLDEIDGLSNRPQFAQFVKGLSETNVMNEQPVPILLIACGTEERRTEMIQGHEPVNRLFDVLSVERFDNEESSAIFESSLKSVGITIKPSALDILNYYAGGYPKMIQVLGNEVFFQDTDRIIDDEDALTAVRQAAAEVGKKYVEPSIYKAISSSSYKSILDVICDLGLSDSFTRSEIVTRLSEANRRNFDNFIRRMKTLEAIGDGGARGKYSWKQRMVHLYIWLDRRAKPTRANESLLGSNENPFTPNDQIGSQNTPDGGGA